MAKQKKEPTVFVPTREQRNRVEELTAADLDHPTIAEELGVSIKILQRHFPDELKNGKMLVRKRAMSELFKQGLKNGSIPALKAIVALTIETKTPNAQKDGGAQVPVVRLGKKAAQKIEAQDANQGLYATPAAPRLAIKNTLQ